MGKVHRLIGDRLISPSPDRWANRLKVYQKDNGEVVIDFRNIKITLLTDEERREWKEGMAQALKTLREKDYLKNDL
jgi:hypothetical protein